MLDIKFIRENKEAVEKAAIDRRYKIDVSALLKLDEERRELLGKVEELRSEQNKISKGINGKPTDAQVIASKKLKEELDKVNPKLKEVEEKFIDLMLLVPNIPSSDTPVGKDDSENVEIKKEGEPESFKFEPRSYIELAEKNNLLETERAVKVGGSRSYILKNELVLLEQSLLRFALDKIRKEGFEVMNVPVIVNEESLVGSGFFPFLKEDVYKVDGKYLVGTSEASLVYYHSGETLQEAELPRLLGGISTCFRREVGAYGKDTKGFFRVHQFQKVEQVVLCRPEDSEKMFNFILNISEEIVRALKLPYRLVQVCTGDLSAKNSKQIDIEVYFPSEKRYRETHSCSYLTDYQARRTNLKYRKESGDKEYVHTLNNTAIATPRILGAILENYQESDGSIKVPEVLKDYVGVDRISNF